MNECGDEWAGPGPGAPAPGWRCRSCGRPSGIGSTCLACIYSAGRLEIDPPTERLHLERHTDITARSGRPDGPPTPVLVVEVVLRLFALLASVTALFALYMGVSLLRYASEPSGAAAALAGLLLGTGLYVLIQVAVAVWIVRGLHQGRSASRLVLSTLPLLDLFTLTNSGLDSVVLLALIVHLGVVALLWAPESVELHFRPSPNAAPGVTDRMSERLYRLVLGRRPTRL